MRRRSRRSRCRACPRASFAGCTLSRDDGRVAFYASDGSVPDDLYSAVLGSAPQRLTSALNPAIRRSDLVVPRKVRFRSYDGVEIPGLLYQPHQASASAKAPALVMVHGGPGGQAQVGYYALTQALVNHGYVVFDINNRGSSGYGKTFFAMDDRQARGGGPGRRRREQADARGDRLRGPGSHRDHRRKLRRLHGARGADAAARRVQAGVDLFGISNWVRTIESIPPWWESFREALYAEIGDPKKDAERLRRISPLFNASKIRAPLMVLQGANDPRVLQVESDEIVAAARKNGVPVEYVVFADEGHGFVKKENEIKGYTAILDFLDTQLKGRAPAAP